MSAKRDTGKKRFLFCLISAVAVAGGKYAYDK